MSDERAPFTETCTECGAPANYIDTWRNLQLCWDHAERQWHAPKLERLEVSTDTGKWDGSGTDALGLGRVQ